MPPGQEWNSPVADPGGGEGVGGTSNGSGGRKAAMPPRPVKNSHKKDGYHARRLIFHVSWAPSPKFLDPLLLSDRDIRAGWVT